MCAFSTVGDVFSDPWFSAPGNSFLWGLGALENPDRECSAGFLIMPKRPYEWRVDTYRWCAQKVVSSHKYLGVLLSPTLSWTKHVQVLISRKGCSLLNVGLVPR